MPSNGPLSPDGFASRMSWTGMSARSCRGTTISLMPIMFHWHRRVKKLQELTPPCNAQYLEVEPSPIAHPGLQLAEGEPRNRDLTGRGCRFIAFQIRFWSGRLYPPLLARPRPVPGRSWPHVSHQERLFEIMPDQADNVASTSSYAMSSQNVTPL